MHYRLIIIVLIILMFPVNVFSKQDLSAFFVNVFDDQTIKIPTGIYTINKTIDIVNRQNITILGDGLVLVIVNNVETAFNLKGSNYIFFKNLIILDKSDGDGLIFINNDQKTVLGIDGMLFFRGKDSRKGSSYISRWDNSTYNSFRYSFSNSRWGDYKIINSLTLSRSYTPYSGDPTDNKTHQTKYNRTDFTSIDQNFLSKVLFTYVSSIKMGIKHDNFGWVELFLSDEFETFANNNNRILSDLEATLVKDQFESTKDHEIRVKNIKRKMIDQNLKFEKDLAQFMISFVEKKEAKNKHLVNKDLIALRKSLRGVEFDKLVDFHYDADRHLYNISSENHAFQCSVKPNDARQLTSGINKAKISGFSRQDHDRISYSDLHIIDGATGNKYPCGHLRELAPKEPEEKLVREDRIKEIESSSEYKDKYLSSIDKLRSVETKVQKDKGSNHLPVIAIEDNNGSNGVFTKNLEFTVLAKAKLDAYYTFIVKWASKAKETNKSLSIQYQAFTTEPSHFDQAKVIANNIEKKVESYFKEKLVKDEVFNVDFGRHKVPGSHDKRFIVIYPTYSDLDNKKSESVVKKSDPMKNKNESIIRGPKQW